MCESSLLKQNFVKWMKASLHHFGLSHSTSLIDSFSTIRSLSPVFHVFFLPPLFIISVSLALLFPFSLLLWTAFPMRCRRGYTQIQEGITEKTSLVTTVSVALLLTNFYNWSVWSHEWKMTILKLWPKKQVGERYSLAIRNLTQILNASRLLCCIRSLCFLFIWSKASIKGKLRPLWSYAGLEWHIFYFLTK